MERRVRRCCKLLNIMTGRLRIDGFSPAWIKRDSRATPPASMMAEKAAFQASMTGLRTLTSTSSTSEVLPLSTERT